MRLTGSVIDPSNPALEIDDNGNFDASDSPNWNALLVATVGANIKGAANSVCRIKVEYKLNSVPKVGLGCGFVIGDELIATNKHVIEAIYSSVGGGEFTKSADCSGIYIL